MGGGAILGGRVMKKKSNPNAEGVVKFSFMNP